MPSSGTMSEMRHALWCCTPRVLLRSFTLSLTSTSTSQILYYEFIRIFKWDWDDWVCTVQSTVVIVTVHDLHSPYEDHRTTAPSSLPLCTQLDSKSHQPLLVPRETTCTVTAVVAMPTAEQAVPDGPSPAPALGPETGGCHR